MEIKPFHHIGLTKILEEQLWLAFTRSGICASEFKKIITLKDFKKQLKEKTGNHFLKVDSLPEDIEEENKLSDTVASQIAINIQIRKMEIYKILLAKATL